MGTDYHITVPPQGPVPAGGPGRAVCAGTCDRARRLRSWTASRRGPGKRPPGSAPPREGHGGPGSRAHPDRSQPHHAGPARLHPALRLAALRRAPPDRVGRPARRARRDRLDRRLRGPSLPPGLDPGQDLDPVADRVLVVTAVITITVHGAVPIWFGVATLAREVVVSVRRAPAGLARRGPHRRAVGGQGRYVRPDVRLPGVPAELRRAPPGRVPARGRLGDRSRWAWRWPGSAACLLRAGGPRPRWRTGAGPGRRGRTG